MYRAEAPRRKEVRKDKGIFEGAARWKGKSWKIGGSPIGAKIKKIRTRITRIYTDLIDNSDRGQMMDDR